MRNKPYPEIAGAVQAVCRLDIAYTANVLGIDELVLVPLDVLKIKRQVNP